MKIISVLTLHESELPTIDRVAELLRRRGREVAVRPSRDDRRRPTYTLVTDASVPVLRACRAEASGGTVAERDAAARAGLEKIFEACLRAT